MSKNYEVDPENIAAIYIDHEKQERLIFTKDQLINQLKRVCKDIAESFDEIYAEEFKQLSSELSYNLPKQFVGFRNALEVNDELKIICGSLLRNATNTIIASTDLLRDGFRLQSGILIRSAIEMCATVIHLLVEKDALIAFKNCKLKSTRSVTIADKQISLFGRTWGILSKYQIHINSIHADWYPMVEYKNKDEIPASVVLGVLGCTMLILDIVTELTFIDGMESPVYWRVLEPGKYQFISMAEDKFRWVEDLLK